MNMHEYVWGAVGAVFCLAGLRRDEKLKFLQQHSTICTFELVSVQVNCRTAAAAVPAQVRCALLLALRFPL